MRGRGGAGETASAAAAVGAFRWTDASSGDSALLLTLAPGARGNSGAALLEVYEIP
jgi:hypothetical protein